MVEVTLRVKSTWSLPSGEGPTIYKVIERSLIFGTKRRKGLRVLIYEGVRWFGTATRTSTLHPKWYAISYLYWSSCVDYHFTSVS